MRRELTEVSAGDVDHAVVQAPAPLSARLPEIFGAPGDTPARLANLDAFLIGGGSIGMNAAFQLARLQPRRLSVCDPRRVKSESFLTHPITDPTALGRSKALLTARICKAISPRTRVFYYEGAIQDLPLDALADATAVWLATDNLATENYCGELCAHLCKTLVQGSVAGELLISQVRVIANEGGGPCLACGWSDEEWWALHTRTVFSCEGRAGRTQVAPAAGAPTMSIAPLCAEAASQMLLVSLRIALGLSGAPRDEIVTYAGLADSITRTKLKRNPRCTCDHSTWKVVVNAKELSGSTLRELLALAGVSPEAGLENVAFVLDDYLFARAALCGCADHPSVGRFVREEDDPGRCAGCGEELRPHPFHSHREVPARILALQLDRTLADLGANAARTLLIKDGERTTLVRNPERSER